MIEKIIHLESISLIDFLGVDNSNIREIAQAFPQAKIVSRGDEIRIRGIDAEIIKINDLVNTLLNHYHKYGKVSLDTVQTYLRQETTPNAESESSENFVLYGVGGAVIRPRTANQRKITEAANRSDLIFAIGPAGTGKTYMAVALAVRALKNKQVKKIVITRPAVEAGESLGFLPGDLKEKIDPYLRPIYDALEDMIAIEKLKYYQEKNVIEIAPLAYMRGRTLNNAFILLDEAQNTTPMQMKMMLTRLGNYSKMIITGDRSQIDLPKKQPSGLIEASKILKNIEGIEMIELSEEDVVRHKLVKQIIVAYDRHDKAQENGRE